MAPPCRFSGLDQPPSAPRQGWNPMPRPRMRSIWTPGRYRGSHERKWAALGIAEVAVATFWAQRCLTLQCRCQGSSAPSGVVLGASPLICEVKSVETPTVLKDLEITKSRFCHGWSITQLRQGYRYCADDILCAYLACQAEPDGKRLLDLGSGIGSVGLAWLAQRGRASHGARCTLLEAQEVSVALCQRTLSSQQDGMGEVDWWDLWKIDGADLRHGDLRNPQILESLGSHFDVVTANPPYLPPFSGNLPNNSQKAHCRHELRGGVSEFCHAAAQLVSPQGSFCMIHAAARLSDVLAALKKYRFGIRRRVDIFFRGNYKSVAVVCSPPTDTMMRSAREEVEKLHVIEPDGSWSPGYLEICKKMGL